MARRFPRPHPLVVVGEPPTFVAVHDSAEYRLAHDALATQWQYVHGRAPAEELLGFLGLRVDGRLIEVDPDRLEEWAWRGEFDLAEVYRELFS